MLRKLLELRIWICIGPVSSVLEAIHFAQQRCFWLWGGPPYVATGLIAWPALLPSQAFICRQLKPLLPGGAGPAAGPQSPAGQRGWGNSHTQRLRALLAQHAQLLTTTFTMAILTPGGSQIAGTAGQMLHALQVGRHTASSHKLSARAWVATPLYIRD